MPLGILLAAAWVEMFSLQEIANEISRGLDFLSSELRDLPHRHRSLRAVFESSWKQLSATEQETFMTLSVFRGGFRREAAQAVAGADLRILITLVNKSLLRRNPRNGRYEMHELLRQHAGEQLDASGHTDRVRMAHCAYFTEFMEVRLERMLGPGQVGALDEIEADFENVRQAWRWAVNQKEHEAVGRATESLFVYSDMRSREHEGEELLNLAREELAPEPDQEPHPSWCMLLLPWYDILLQSKGRPADIEEIRTQAHTALAFANKRGDDLGIAHGLILLAHFADPRQAIQMHDQALTLVPRLDDSFWVRIRIGFSYRALGEYHKAISAFQRSFERGREIGEKEKMGWCLFNIGETEMTNGDYVSAVTHLRQAKPFFHQVGNAMGVIWTNIDLGLMALLNGEFEDARSLVEEAVAVAEKANRSPSTMKHLLLLQGYLSLVEGHYQNGQQRLEEVLSISSPPAEAALGLVFAACGQRDRMLARQRLQLALQSQIPYRIPATADLVLPAAALIFGQEGGWVRAVELLALAHHRPACPKGLLERWPLLTRFQMEVEACLLPEAYAAAWERGLALDMADVMAGLRERFQPIHPGPEKDTISLIGTDHLLVEPLTRRELEVLNLIAAGLTNQEIASELVIALGTVKAHTSSIYGKLGVHSRTQAVVKGRELQFLS
jgi:DNA-binding CsgD family transcriptional regulator/tetratricopeptide (TPR) repeat protein